MCHDRHELTMRTGSFFALLLSNSRVPSMIFTRANNHSLQMLDVRAVDRDTLEPVLFLLQSHDVEVQRAASAALGNLAVNSTFPIVANPTCVGE